MLKRRYRYAIEALVIVVVVAIGLFVLSQRQEQQRQASARANAAPPSLPKDPWRPSPDYDAEANADFALQVSGPGNVRLAGTQAGADWPNFNGPRRENKSLETGLLKKWPPAGPKLAWMCRGLGAGFASVSVAKGTVYTMGNKGKCEAVIALDAGTGEKIWSTPFAWAAHLRAGDGPVSTPTVSEGAVYALGGYGDLVCVDAHSGEIRWQKNILREFNAEVLECGMRESVLIDGNRLICTPGGKQAAFAALDARTGDVIWSTLVPGHDRASYASPVVAEVGGVRQYIQFTARGTIGVRAETGELLWRDDSASNTTANCSSPLVAGDFVFTSSGYGGGGSLVKLSANGPAVKADLVYHTRDMQSRHDEMVIVDGLLYGSSEPGILTCLELATGKVKWRSRTPGKAAITYADGRFYLRTEQGTVVLVEATGTGYHELGRFEQPERSKSSAWSHPVVAAGRLFLSDQDLLFCYDLKAAT
jgi:outer membrane protein assembly factor BamB